MGILSEVSIIRLSDQRVFDGHCWTHDDGSFEAFWYEGSQRACIMFDSEGIQLGSWKKYQLAIK